MRKKISVRGWRGGLDTINLLLCSVVLVELSLMCIFFLPGGLVQKDSLVNSYSPGGPLVPHYCEHPQSYYFIL